MSNRAQGGGLALIRHAAQQSVRRWLIHRNALMDLVEKLPEHTAEWRPWSDGFTTLQLLHHLAWTVDFFLAAIEGRGRQEVPMPTSVAEARKLLADLKEKQAAAISGYSDSELNKMVSIPVLNVNEPAADILHRMIGHEAHHKGQLWLYCRMLGIQDLPFYVAHEPFEAPVVRDYLHSKQVIKRWVMHRDAVIALADRLPEDVATWRPWANGFTTLQLLHHIAWTVDFFLSAIEAREMRQVPMPSSIKEAVHVLAELKHQHMSSIGNYSEADLQKTVEIPMLRVNEPAVDVLHRMIYHEAHHKGQLWVYARMMGIVPPFYVS